MEKRDTEIGHLIETIIKRLQEIGLIVLIAIVSFILLSLGSYNYADPAWSNTGINSEVTNVAGIFGAYISDLFLSLFGYIGYFIPVIIAWVFSILFKKTNFKPKFIIFLLKILGSFLLLSSACTLVNLHIEPILNLVPLSSGGIVGSIIEGLTLPWLGKVGLTMTLIFATMVGITLVTNLSWIEILDFISDLTIAILSGFKFIVKFVAKYIANNLKKLSISLYKFIFINYIFKLLGFKVVQKTNIAKQNFNENKNQNKVKTIMRKLFDKLLFGNKKNNLITNDNFSINLSMDNNKSILESNMDKNSMLINSNFLYQTNDQHNIPCLNIDTKIEPLVTLSSYIPNVDILQKNTERDNVRHFSKEVLNELSDKVENILADFGAEVKVVSIYPGPVITRFELSLKAGLKVSKISSLAKDIARSLSVSSVRVVEVIPGKSVIGLEIPNQEREIVRLRDIIDTEEYKESKSKLALALGKDIAGMPVIADLAKMPHLLVAGTTGSGKSVGVNAMLLSILYKASPEEVGLILIDPKMLELSIYEGIPHLLAPVVTDMKDAANALKWCVEEMERRYQLMAAVGVRNLTGFNQKITEATNNNKPILDPLWQPGIGEDNSPSQLTKLPRIVVIIDEFADMMMIVGKKVEELIARIAQKARAAGIHMILATQRPSVDVITGLIKANIPTRIAFQVSSKIDSRTILDQMGAEQLLGNGDMLYLPPGSGIPNRVHGAFVSDQEVHAVVKHLKKFGQPNYALDFCSSSSFSVFSGFSDMNDMERDELYDEAVAIVIETGKTSASNLQRRFKIGYNRAARLVEEMEANGILSPVQPNGMREVLVSQNNG